MSGSDRPLFSAYILLSEALRFNTAEIRAALIEDYPELDLSQTGPSTPDFDCDTDAFITAPVLLDGPGKDETLATLIRLPGYGRWQMAELEHRQTRIVPDMADALARNRSYICVSVGAKGDTLIEQFRAARLCSCLAAVFARLPVALAVYWESADHFLPPERVVAMAGKAVQGEWPVLDWISFVHGLKPPPDMPPGQADRLIKSLQSGGQGGLLAVSGTRGLLPFKGYEMGLAPAPIRPDDAVTTVAVATQMQLERGHVFKDGQTLGAEGQAPEDSYRLRLITAGTEPGIDHDVLMLIHPDSSEDFDRSAGPRRPWAGPTRQDRGRPGLFKRLIKGRA